MKNKLMFLVLSALFFVTALPVYGDEANADNGISASVPFLDNGLTQESDAIATAITQVDHRCVRRCEFRFHSCQRSCGHGGGHHNRFCRERCRYAYRSCLRHCRHH